MSSTSPAVDAASTFLAAQLVDGPRSASAVFAAAKVAGIPPVVLNRGADRLRVVRRRDAAGVWHWCRGRHARRLPREHAA